MQKIMSARLDEAAIDEMDRVTRKLGISKRQFLEEAILQRAAGLSRDEHGDVWSDTLGAWQRREGGATTIRRARRVFQRSVTRHDGARRARVRR